MGTFVKGSQPRSSLDQAAVPSGLLIVDKPPGMTSHDVVARVRRLLGVRKVGHAGTLDPLASGVLVLGIGAATRLLGHLALTTKTYEATIQLGVSTVSDDAQGEIVAIAPADHLDVAKIAHAMTTFVGTIEQVPSAVSAVKVGGVRAHARVRAGEQVRLAPRQVAISQLDLVAVRHDQSKHTVDIDVAVECSSGTYVRALARDLGTVLDVGGHITALRRTKVGPFTVDSALSLDELALAKEAAIVPLSTAVETVFARRDITADLALRLRQGQQIPGIGLPGLYAVFALGGSSPAQTVVALVTEAVNMVVNTSGAAQFTAKPIVVFPDGGS